MSELLHATAVAFGGHAVLLVGASGSGKSMLGWMLLGLGGTLVADDRVQADRRDEGLWLSAPERLQGKIEARGIGVLQVAAKPAWARLVVDMGQLETERGPPLRERQICQVKLPLLYRVESPAFAAMLQGYLQGGPWDGGT